MKKIILLILLSVFIVTPVYARENKLYFTESDNRIYYESKLVDENYFLKHLNMVPGNKFVDKLLIENGTKTTYTLYFKVVPRIQSDEANEFLENIDMKISLDGDVIYEGKATGLDYTNKGVNLQAAVLLGEFSPNKESTMLVETSLPKEYSNTEYNDFSYIDWTFYAQYDDNEPEEIIKVPDTYKKSFPFIYVISIIIIFIGLGILIYAHKKEK